MLKWNEPRSRLNWIPKEMEMLGMPETHRELDELKVDTSDSSKEEACATCFTDNLFHIGFNAKHLFINIV